MRVAVIQSNYLPWRGYFDIIHDVDVFVFYDDVQYDKHGWRNRNRIKCEHGVRWLTVPVRHGGLGPQQLVDVAIDESRAWARKHVATLRQCYAHAPHTDAYLPELEEILGRPRRSLVELDLDVALLLARWLEVDVRLLRSSELGVAGARSDRLLSICRRLGAERYLSGDAARAYLDVELFTTGGVAVEWQTYAHPVYHQLHGDFVSHLSAIDLVLNCGRSSAAILACTA